MNTWRSSKIIHNSEHLDKFADRDAWLEAHSTRMMTIDSVKTESLMLVAPLAIALIRYPYAHHDLLFAWLFIALASSFCRIYVLNLFNARLYADDYELIKAFRSKIKPMYILSSPVLGSACAVIFSGTDYESQFLGLIIMIGWTLFSSHFLSPHRSTALIYVQASKRGTKNYQS